MPSAEEARLACSARPGHAESVQLSATARLAITCEPPEGNGEAAPCLYEPFFHFARGFEDMSEAEMANHSDKRRNGLDPYVQCRTRRVGHDEDWPTVDVHLQRNDRTKTITNVTALLGSRRVAIVGASLVRQTIGAVQCQLEAAGLRRDHELQWRHWGWATFTQDNQGCDNVTSMEAATRVEKLRASGCVPRGSKFARLLSWADVVVIAYNPQHYAGSLAWWRFDLEIMLPMLASFARQPGKLAVIREPAAQHFAGGAFEPKYALYASETRGCCVPLSPAEAHSNFNYDATLAVHELVAQMGGGRVRVLPWYNLTLSRWQAHVGTRASCFERKHVEKFGRAIWTRSTTCGCDCTHFCYTPLMYDAMLFTPLHAMLAQQRRHEQHAEQRARRLSDSPSDWSSRRPFKRRRRDGRSQ